MSVEFDLLIGEWYAYQGYYVRTNIHLPWPASEKKGGYKTEADVLAFRPNPLEYIHIEGFWSSLSREKAFEKFRKFYGRYSELFLNTTVSDVIVKKIAVGGWASGGRQLSGVWEEEKIRIEYITVPELWRVITAKIGKQDPWHTTIPENLPRLRAIQMALYYGEIYKGDKNA